MKYSHYSMISGLSIYLLVALFVIVITLFIIKNKHITIHFEKAAIVLCIIQLISLVGDGIIWLNSWVYPPIAMPYDSAGEQVTIFTLTLGMQ